jgi:hypothetical protein
MSTVEELQSKFGVAGNVEIVAGTNGLARVDLHLGEAAAQVYLLGATVTSFKDTPTHEIIWLRYDLIHLFLIQMSALD